MGASGRKHDKTEFIFGSLECNHLTTTTSTLGLGEEDTAVPPKRKRVGGSQVCSGFVGRRIVPIDDQICITGCGERMSKSERVLPIPDWS